MQIIQRKDHPAVRDPSSKFLNSFWDLASDDGDVRRTACVYIIEHLEGQKYLENNIKNDIKKDNGIIFSTKDGQYALKRLIRGLGSSRQSARRGFASCLCEILKRIEDEHINEYWNILNESTQVTGSLKGAEERDLLFGKLFGYSALIRSNQLKNHQDLAMKTLNGLLDLYKKKEWFQEVVVEVIFDLLNELDDNIIIETVVPLLIPFFPEKLENMSPNQLLFTAGIERLFKDNDKVSEAISPYLLKKKIFSIRTIDIVGPTLIKSCSGFPKIHRVWDYVLASFFPMDLTRKLNSSRIEKLSDKKEKYLRKLLEFIDTSMLGASGTHEKRAVAMHLLIQTISKVPPEFIAVVLSKSCIRNLLTARRQKKNILFQYSGKIIKSMGEAVGTDTRCRLAMASALQQYGGVNFDKLTNTTIISDMLQNVEGEAVVSHIEFLCTLLLHPSSENDDDEKATNKSDEINSTSSMNCTLEALVAMCKNNQLQCQSEICCLTILILIRIACLKDCTHTRPVTKSKKSKSKKSKGDSENISSIFSDSHIRILDVIEKGMTEFSGASIERASSLLVTLLKDVGHVQYGDTVEGVQPTVLSFAVSSLNELVNCGSTPLRESNKVDGEVFEPSIQDIVKESFESISFIVESSKTNEDIDADTKKLLKVTSSMNYLLGHSLFMILVNDELNLDAAFDLNRSAKELIKKGKQGSLLVGIDETENDDEESPLLQFFEACMEFLSVEGAMKAIRDGVKKSWDSLAQWQGVSLSILETAMQAVLGEDALAEEEDGVMTNDVENVDLDDDGSVEEDEKNKSKKNTSKENKTTQKTKEEKNINSASSDDEDSSKDSDDDDDDDEADVKIDSNQALNMLLEDMQDDDDDDVEENFAASDAALASMVDLQKKSRKAGLLNSKRKELLIRTRAVDILEVLIGRCESYELLVPITVPLLSALKTVQQSKLAQSIAEGRAFTSRLSIFMLEKMFKKKYVLRADTTANATNSSFDVVNAFKVLLNYLSTNLNGQSPFMRDISASCMISVYRGAISSDIPDVRSDLESTITNLFSQFIHKKTCRVPGHIFDELISRHVDYATGTLLSELAKGTNEAASSFLQVECFRMLSAIIRQHKAMDDACRNTLSKGLTSTVSSIEKSFNLPEAQRDLRAKRVKQIIQCAKDIAIFESTYFKKNSKLLKKIMALIVPSNLEPLPHSARMMMESIGNINNSESPSSESRSNKKQKQ